jgi:pyruvate dehydrogenase E1 component alpha subunit
MHLFSPQHLAASSGIVGASAPTAAGMALSAQHLRPGKIAIAYFGEGAMNQGMLMEAFNLAVVWDLPVVFVCKHNGWSITTHAADVTGGNLVERAGSFSLPALEVDGSDVEAVWQAAGESISRARDGSGPTFLLAHCTRIEGHFLGDPLLRIVRTPVEGFMPYAGPLTRSTIAAGGGSAIERAASLIGVTTLLGQVANDHRLKKSDPVKRLRRKLVGDKARLEQVERDTAQEIEAAVTATLSDITEGK